MSLARDWNEFKITEASISIYDLQKAAKEKRIKEMFGSGTAAIVSPIKNINFDGKDIKIPLDPRDPNSQAGPLSRRLANHITNIQYGEIPHEWSIEI